MTELRTILEESVARVFDENIDNDFLSQVEESGWPEELWNTIGELGVPKVLVSVDRGGMGGSWADTYVVIRRCGYACIPLPVPEIILAAWFAEHAAIELPGGPPGLIPHPISAGEVADDSFNKSIARIP